MIEEDDWKFRARKMLIESVMKEIDISKEPSRAYSEAFYAVSKLGLHMKAKNEGLFDQVLWQEREKLGAVMRCIEEFLWREIK